jgi:hypothetical protein
MFCHGLNSVVSFTLLNHLTALGAYLGADEKFPTLTRSIVTSELDRLDDQSARRAATT